MNNHVNIEGMSGTIQPNGLVQFGDERTNVNFYKKSVVDAVKSRENGRPFYVSKDYVRIQHPGERDYIDRPVENDESVMYRWPVQWAQYQRNQTQVPEGTPIDCLFPQSPDQAANMHALGVHTVEQMAHLTAEGLEQVGMGAAQWQQMAKRFLATSSKGVEFHQLQRELEKRDAQLAAQSNELAEMRRALQRLSAERQGVPQAMIPSDVQQSTQAGAYAATVSEANGVLPASAFGNDAPSTDAGMAFDMPEDVAQAPRRGRPPKVRG